MSQQKVVQIIRLVLEYGFLSYGVFFEGWSPLFLLFGFWLEGFVRLFFTNVLVLVSKGAGKWKFLSLHNFMFLFAQFVHFIFLIIFGGMLVGRDPFVLNILGTFFPLDGKSVMEWASVLLESGKAVDPVGFQKDVLHLLMVISFAYFIPTVVEIFALRRNNQEWKQARLSLASFGKTHCIIIVMGWALTFFHLYLPSVQILGVILIVVGFLSDLSLLRKGSIQTIQEFIDASRKKRM